MFHQCKVCKKITFKVFFAVWWNRPHEDVYYRKIWGLYRTEVCKACVRKAGAKGKRLAEESLLNQYHTGEQN